MGTLVLTTILIRINYGATLSLVPNRWDKGGRRKCNVCRAERGNEREMERRRKGEREFNIYHDIPKRVQRLERRALLQKDE